MYHSQVSSPEDVYRLNTLACLRVYTVLRLHIQCLALHPAALYATQPHPSVRALSYSLSAALVHAAYFKSALDFRQAMLFTLHVSQRFAFARPPAGICHLHPSLLLILASSCWTCSMPSQQQHATFAPTTPAMNHQHHSAIKNTSA